MLLAFAALVTGRPLSGSGAGRLLTNRSQLPAFSRTCGATLRIKHLLATVQSQLILRALHPHPLHPCDSSFTTSRAQRHTLAVSSWPDVGSMVAVIFLSEPQTVASFPNSFRPSPLERHVRLHYGTLCSAISSSLCSHLDVPLLHSFTT